MPAFDDRLRGGTKGDVRRAERLAAELRENLKRRKARSRGQKSEALADQIGASSQDDDMAGGATGVQTDPSAANQQPK